MAKKYVLTMPEGTSPGKRTAACEHLAAQLGVPATDIIAVLPGYGLSEINVPDAVPDEPKASAPPAPATTTPTPAKKWGE